MSAVVVTSIVTLSGAVVTTAGTVGAAVITNRKKDAPTGFARAEYIEQQPGTPPAVYRPLTEPYGKLSKAFVLGLISLVTAWVPVLGIFTIAPGLYIGLRERGGPRRRVQAGLVMLWIALGILVLSAAVGAAQGSHACYQYGTCQ